MNGRIRRLEDILAGAVGTPEEREAAEQLRRECLEQMQRHMESAREKAEVEAAAGDYRRLHALEELEEHIRRRGDGA